MSEELSGSPLVDRRWPLLGRLNNALQRAELPTMRRYLASGVTLVGGAALQLGSFIILARALGIEQFGTLVVVTAVTALAGAACGVGCGDAMIRRIARDPAAYPLMLGHGAILIASTGVGLSALSTVILILVANAAPTITGNILAMSFFSLSGVLFSSAIGFVERIYIGRDDFNRANLINGGFSFVRFVATAVACLIFDVDTLAAWADWMFAAHLVACVLAIATLRPFPTPIWRIDRHELRLGFHFSTPTFVDAVRQNLDRIMLGAIGNALAVGSYGTAMRIVQTSQVVVWSFNRLAYRIFAARAHLGPRGILPMAIRYLLVVAIIASATSIGLFVTAPLVPTVVGHQYAPVTGDLRVLCWLLIPIAIRELAYDIFGALDQHHVRAAIYNYISVAGAALTAAGVYFFGVSGAFVSVYLVQMALAVAMWLQLIRAARTEATTTATVTSESDGDSPGCRDVNLARNDGLRGSS